MFFRDIVGQKELVADLTREVDSGKISHGKLFVGSPGYGTLAAALAYSRFVLCEQRGTEDSCGQCVSCQQMTNLQHPDVHFVFPVVQTITKTSDGVLKEWRETVMKSPYFTLYDWLKIIDDKERNPIIGTEESKEIVRKINLKSFQGGYKIMVIFGAQQMNRECSNKLLKALEEPPSKTLFLLLTEQHQDILPTIQSRTQAWSFQRLKSSEVATYLEKKVSMPKEEAFGLASFAEGDLCQALQLCGAGESTEGFRDAFISLMRCSYKKDVNEMMTWAEVQSGLTKERQKIFILYVLHMLRQCLAMNYLGAGHARLTTQELGFAVKFSPFITGNNIRPFIEVLDNSYYHIDRNANAKLVFTELTFNVMRLIHRA